MKAKGKVITGEIRNLNKRLASVVHANVQDIFSLLPGLFHSAFPLVFSTIVEIEHFALWAAILVSYVPTLAWGECQIYFEGGERFWGRLLSWMNCHVSVVKVCVLITISTMAVFVVWSLQLRTRFNNSKSSLARVTYVISIKC